MTNSNILFPLVKIQQLVAEMQKYDVSALSEDEVFALREDADKLLSLAHKAVSQSLKTMSRSDAAILEECERELNIWAARRGITDPQTLLFLDWIRTYSAEPAGLKMPATIRETLDWLREQNVKVAIG